MRAGRWNWDSESSLPEVVSIELEELESVVALADLKVGTTLCVIPKDSILSVKNTAIADLLEQEQLGGIVTFLGLAIEQYKSRHRLRFALDSYRNLSLAA